MVIVTFRNALDNACCMFTESFKTVKDAKNAILEDANHFIKAHKYHSGPVGMKFRESKKWIDPKGLDYFMARGQDGTVCYWQYFNR